MLNERGQVLVIGENATAMGDGLGCSLPTSLARAGTGDYRWHQGAEPMTAQTADFERHRLLLFSIAYRMLGSVAEAEDVLQEAYLR